MNEAQLQAIIAALDQITIRIGQAADTLQSQAQKLEKPAIIDTQEKQQNEQLKYLQDQNQTFQSGLLNIQNILSKFVYNQQQTADEESVRNKVQQQQIMSVRIVGMSDDVASLLHQEMPKTQQQESGWFGKILAALVPLLGGAGVAMTALNADAGPLGSFSNAAMKFVFMITGFKDKIAKLVSVLLKVPETISSFFGKNFDDILLDVTAKIEKVFPKIADKLLDIGMSVGKRAGMIIDLIPGSFKTIASSIGGILAKTFKGGLKALKLVPYLGNLVNLYFAYQRFTSGDISGGFLELASGLADFVPGIGNVLGIGIDLYLMARDLTAPPEPTKKPESGGFMQMLQSIKGYFIGALSNIPNMPVLGNIYRFGQGIIKTLSGDVAGGMRQALEAIAGWIPMIGGPMMSAFDYVSSFFTALEEPAAAVTRPQGSVSLNIKDYVKQKFNGMSSLVRGAVAAVGGPLASMFSAFGASGADDLANMLNNDNSNALIQNINSIGTGINASYNAAVEAINQTGLEKLKQLSPTLQNFNANVNTINSGGLMALQETMYSIRDASQQAASNVAAITNMQSNAKSSSINITGDLSSEQNVTNNILSEMSSNSQALLMRLLEAGIQQIKALNVIAQIIDNKNFDVNVKPQINLNDAGGGSGFGYSTTQDQLSTP